MDSRGKSNVGSTPPNAQKPARISQQCMEFFQRAEAVVFKSIKGIYGQIGILVELCLRMRSHWTAEKHLDSGAEATQIRTEKAQAVTEGIKKGQNKAWNKRRCDITCTKFPKIPASKSPLHQKQRFFVAAAVSLGLLFFCDSDWMEEGWDGKDHVQLFTEGDMAHESGIVTISPTLSCILNSAPRSSPQARGEERPISDEERFQRHQILNKDPFVLGILLIELCLNKTFEQLCRPYRDDSDSRFSSSGATAVGDYEIALMLKDDVILDAGDLYGHAVERCLRCQFPGRDVTKRLSFQQFRTEYFEQVVAPVYATYDTIPGSLEEL
ncbi:hypothetical protein B0T17DRAFT_636598 [Bombardia bombarda]|uniref:DUF7580 domain-containing protein n=1 Tax=Bombardia bombarda TaxID=252184 RepID=A0AA39XB78_9PEZI|nr:hypothetical protein B0T17DRAFT_636598 [Bombardia bombarda]